MENFPLTAGPAKISGVSRTRRWLPNTYFVSRNLYEQAFNRWMRHISLSVAPMAQKTAITGRKLSVAFAAALFIIIVLFSSLVYVSLNQTRDLKSQNDRLQSENAEIAEQNKALRSQERELQEQTGKFLSNESELQNRLYNLQSQNNNLNEDLANVNGQVSVLKDQLANLTTAQLTLSNENVIDVHYYEFNNLYIRGSVGNTGLGTAYNAGLHVVAYTADGTMEINMTVPLKVGASYGTDEATSAVAAAPPFSKSSLELGTLGSQITADVSLSIFHHGAVTNWTISPVWTKLMS
jgi:hypothetical protein